MNKKIQIATMALLGSAFHTALHASPVAANYGDLILGFETTAGGTKNLEIDLGSYASLSSFTTLNLYSDLTNVFGNSFSSTVSYGVYGVVAPIHWSQVYLTAPNGQAAFGALPHGNTSANQDYTGLVDTYNLQLTNGVTTADGVSVSSSALGAWSTYLPSTSPFGVSADHNIETTIGSSLNLFDKTYTPNVVDSTPYSIEVNSSGLLTVETVPEPATEALIGMGILIAAVSYRRHTRN